MQKVNNRLTNVVRKVRDCSSNIINECEALIQGVIGANVPGSVPGDRAPGEGGAPSSSSGEESVGSVEN